jgi:hypothetical protein
VDASKLGHRHPWAFTNPALLTGKTVRLFTTCLSDKNRDMLEGLTAAAVRIGCTFTYHESQPIPSDQPDELK